MKATRTRFEVSGWGEFPVDMLRYDQCYPVAGEFSPRHGARFEARRVTLERIHDPKHPDPITFDRWSSFLWSVDRDSIKSEPY